MIEGLSGPDQFRIRDLLKLYEQSIFPKSMYPEVAVNERDPSEYRVVVPERTKR